MVVIGMSAAQPNFEGIENADRRSQSRRMEKFSTADALARSIPNRKDSPISDFLFSNTNRMVDLENSDRIRMWIWSSEDPFKESVVQNNAPELLRRQVAATLEKFFHPSLVSPEASKDQAKLVQTPRFTESDSYIVRKEGSASRSLQRARNRLELGDVADALSILKDGLAQHPKDREMTRLLDALSLQPARESSQGYPVLAKPTAIETDGHGWVALLDGISISNASTLAELLSTISDNPRANEIGILKLD